MADLIAADELAEAEQEIRDRLAECPRGDGGQPKLLMYHLVEILLAEYDRRGQIEQRAKIVAGEAPAPKNTVPSPSQSIVTACWILRGDV